MQEGCGIFYAQRIEYRTWTQSTPEVNNAMSTILVTGATGFLGSRLTAALAGRHRVLALTRAKRISGDAVHVRGAFSSFEDLRALDAHTLDAAVHLAAVTGGCTEEETLAVNVDGTRRLLRYLLDRGCRRIVLASSIAAVGCLDGPNFLPLRLPMPDDHPCLARDAYGLSKFLMEELTGYFARRFPDAALPLLRIGAVLDETHLDPATLQDEPPLWGPFCQLARVATDDVVCAFTLALEAPLAPGLRRWNVVAPEASCARPVAEVLRAHYAGREHGLDWSYFERDGNAFAPVYAMEAIRRDLGFTPQISVRPAAVRARAEKKT